MWSRVKSFVGRSSSRKWRKPTTKESGETSASVCRDSKPDEESTGVIGHESQPPLAKHDSSILDLAFVMDCTSSMSSYIDSAKNNIRKIVEEIVAHEKSNVRMALVEYRDHPPQDSSFVTRPHDFTPKIGKMKSWLEGCKASGGGDLPEAVADGLHQLLKLSWRTEATKIAVLISDAPPHGLGASGDELPNGCPDGLDPMEVTRKLAKKGITLYVIGCEPSLKPYKVFFMGLAYLTGGQYVPLAAANALTQVIIGGAQEELSLEKWMEEVNKEVQAEVEAKGAENFDDESFAKAMTDKMVTAGIKSRVLLRNESGIKPVSRKAQEVSKMRRLSDVRAAEVVCKDRNKRRKKTRLRINRCGIGGGTSDNSESSGSESDSDAVDDRLSGCSSASENDDYDCASVDIQFNQVKRMVHKSKMRNRSWFKSGSDSE